MTDIVDEAYGISVHLEFVFSVSNKNSTFFHIAKHQIGNYGNFSKKNTNFSFQPFINEVRL